jgi:hypothetical protein
VSRQRAKDLTFMRAADQDRMRRFMQECSHHAQDFTATSHSCLVPIRALQVTPTAAVRRRRVSFAPADLSGERQHGHVAWQTRMFKGSSDCQAAPSSIEEPGEKDAAAMSSGWPPRLGGNPSQEGRSDATASASQPARHFDPHLRHSSTRCAGKKRV